MAKGKFHTQWQWALSSEGEGLVVIRNEEKGRERRGVGKVTQKVEVVGNRKRLKVAAASAFLVANEEMAMMPMRGEGGCYEVPPQLGDDEGQNAADAGPWRVL